MQIGVFCMHLCAMLLFFPYFQAVSFNGIFSCMRFEVLHFVRWVNVHDAVCHRGGKQRCTLSAHWFYTFISQARSSLFNSQVAGSIWRGKDHSSESFMEQEILLCAVGRLEKRDWNKCSILQAQAWGLWWCCEPSLYHCVWCTGVTGTWGCCNGF